MQILDGILYCPNLNLSMCFKVGSKSPDTFKEKFPVVIVNNSLQLFPIFKESSILHEPQKSEVISISEGTTHDWVQPWENMKNLLS